MSTLKEAIESGRRYRLTPPGMEPQNVWFGPGHDGRLHFSSQQALCSDFEIEPEPEKLREWWVHDNGIGDSLRQLAAFRKQADARSMHGDCHRVHDADVCDRQRKVCAQCAETISRCSSHRAGYFCMLKPGHLGKHMGPGSAGSWEMGDY